jgi:hypothetical protein
MRAALGVRAGAKECRQHLWKSFGTGTNNNLKTASDFELDLKLGLAEAGFARAIGTDRRDPAGKTGPLVIRLKFGRIGSVYGTVAI